MPLLQHCPLPPAACPPSRTCAISGFDYILIEHPQRSPDGRTNNQTDWRGFFFFEHMVFWERLGRENEFRYRVFRMFCVEEEKKKFKKQNRKIWEKKTKSRWKGNWSFYQNWNTQTFISFLAFLFFFFFVFCFLFFISSTKGVRFGKTSIPGVQYQYQTAEPGGGEGR